MPDNENPAFDIEGSLQSGDFGTAVISLPESPTDAY
jgi:hypothetical protein